MQSEAIAKGSDEWPRDKVAGMEVESARET